MEAIEQIINNKKRYLDLLLLADEQESMIDLYLERGDMFVLYRGDSPVSSIVVTNEGEGVYEIKSIATYPEHQGKGYARRLIGYVETHYRGIARTWLVGTGETPQILSFYAHCGFTYSHRIPNFFIDNYDHPMIEDGKLLTDMVYLKKEA
ncbi:MAG: GNAT family N-acetyltransferase [Mediterranea sp.]|jgi:GNAT superfamily N-acetyltransferase|nr:GNAT family N-acetyltransferase [Mediterranea sp.]